MAVAGAPLLVERVDADSGHEADRGQGDAAEQQQHAAGQALPVLLRAHGHRQPLRQGQRLRAQRAAADGAAAGQVRAALEPTGHAVPVRGVRGAAAAKAGQVGRARRVLADAARLGGVGQRGGNGREQWRWGKG